MKAFVYIGPADVSFTNITTEEDTCLPITAEGYFTYQSNESHPASTSPVQMTETVDPDKGTLSAGTDTIRGGTLGPIYGPGTFIWPIPWLYSVGGGGKHPITIVNHVKTLTFEGGKWTLTIEKNGIKDSVKEP
jgi:hypothetical protein